MLGNPDPDLTFQNVPVGAAVIALWHEPDFAEETARRGAFLQLSGHSHGGQIRLPFAGALVAPPGGKRFVHGLNAVAGMPIYTSRGVGIYRPPLRFHCPPEVTLVELTRSCPDGKTLDIPQRKDLDARFTHGRTDKCRNRIG
jgi:predicted MPP superfamily phosphohydrolase